MVREHFLGLAGRFTQRILVDVSELLIEQLDSLGRALVGTDAESIFVRHLHQFGGLIENVGNSLVLQGGTNSFLNR